MRQVTPRSYLMETEEGNLLRRNRQHILWMAEPFHSSKDIADNFNWAHQEASGISQEINRVGTSERLPVSGHSKMQQLLRGTVCVLGTHECICSVTVWLLTWE